MEVDSGKPLVEMVELIKRHSQLHKVNIKYGYILFGITVFIILIRTIALWFYQKQWQSSGRSTTSLRISKLPTPITISFLTLIIAILIMTKPHLNEITVVVKRTARLSYALVPLDIFLASEPAWFSVDNYLNTIQLHKWVSRIIVLLAIIHSVGFLLYYASVGTMGNVFKPLNFLGFLTFLLANVMLVFWKPVRNYSYQLFYVYHNFFMVLFITLIYFHARPGVGFYFFLNCVLLFSSIGKKYFYSKDITISEIIENSGSDYKIIKFPKSLLPESYLPGCHVRIGYSKWSPFFLLLPTHPYTVATTFEGRNLLSSLVVKQTKFKLEPFETYSVQPNFQSSLSLNFFNTADNVNIVCGGSGVSFGLGIFEYFKRCIIADGKDIKLKFVWITKKEEDLFILKDLGVEGVDIYISNSESDELDTIQDEINNNSDIPLADYDNRSHDSLSTLENDFTNIAIVGKRPNIEVILEKNLIKTIDYANKWIISCGPPSLNNECNRIAAKQKCRFFSEEYAF